MSDATVAALAAVVVATISGVFQVITSRALRGRTSAMDKKLENIGEQVQNHHDTNLRDDITHLITEQKSHGEQLSRLGQSFQGTASDVRGLRRDIGRLADSDRDAARDIQRAHARIDRIERRKENS